MKKILLLAALTVCAWNVTGQTYSYIKVRSALTDWSGEYLIVKEVDSLNMAIVFNGSLTDLDEKHNCFRVAVENGRIASTAQTDAATFTVRSADAAAGTWYIRSKSGYYIGYNKADSANLGYNVDAKYVNRIAFESDTTTKVKITAAGGYVLRYNKNEESDRFRYYAEGKKKAIHLYKKVDITALPAEEAASKAPVDGSLYMLPKGFWIMDGKVVWRGK